VPAWTAWKKGNDDFVRSSRALEATGILDPAKFRGDLQRYRADHHQLMGQVMTMLRTGRVFEGGDDHTTCNFAHWMANLKTENATLKNILAGIKDSHAPFHQGIAQAKERIKAGDRSGAEALLTSMIIPGATGTFEQFDQMLAQVEQSEALFESLQREALVTLRDLQTAALTALNKVVKLNQDIAVETVADAHHVAVIAKTTSVAGIVIGVVLAMGFGFVLTRSITGPVKQGVHLTEEIAKGNFSLRLKMNRGDEIGVLADALDGMADNLSRNVEIAEEIAKGNLNVEVQLASEKDQLGLALQAMVLNLNEIIGQIQVAGEQIATGSSQISDGAQSLSQGATESAASVEEITGQDRCGAGQQTDETDGQRHGRDQ